VTSPLLADALSQLPTPTSSWSPSFLDSSPVCFGETINSLCGGRLRLLHRLGGVFDLAELSFVPGDLL
jgi:hypothetical protein